MFSLIRHSWFLEVEFLGQSLQQWMPMGSCKGRDKSIFFSQQQVLKTSQNINSSFLEILVLFHIRVQSTSNSFLYKYLIATYKIMCHDKVQRHRFQKNSFSMSEMQCYNSQPSPPQSEINSFLDKWNAHLCKTSTKIRICKIFFWKKYTQVCTWETVELADTTGYIKIRKCRYHKFGSLLCLQIIFELWVPYKPNILGTWLSSGISILVIVFEKVIHGMKELRMSP